MQHRRLPVHLAQAVLSVAALAADSIGNAHAADSHAPGMRLAGEGRLHWFGFDVYDARLWVQPGFNAQQFERHGFVLELAYLREFSGANIAQRSLDEIRKLGPVDRQRAQAWLDALRGVLPDVRPGDRIAGVHKPGRGVEFLHNGKRVGAIDDPEFSSRFFAIWLSPSTPQPSLRAKLLQGAGQ